MSKVAILVLDTPQKELSSYGDFGDQVKSLLTSSPSAKPYEYVKYNTCVNFDRPTWPELDSGEFAAVVLTGSRNSVNDDEQWIKYVYEFLVECFQRVASGSALKFKLIGICYGHQIIAKAIAQTVDKNVYGWDIGVKQIELTEEFSKAFSKTLKGKTTLNLAEVHQDVVHVSRLPAGWHSIGSSGCTSCEGLYKAGHVLTFQGHPEFDDNCLATLTKKIAQQGAFDAKTEQASLDSIETVGSERLVARELIWEFLS